MAKRYELDGKFYRMRRGVLVQIPDEWVGHTTHPQNIRKRKEEAKVKHRNIAQTYRQKKDLENIYG